MIFSVKKKSSLWTRLGLVLAVGIVFLYQFSPSYVEAECADINPPTPPKIELIRTAHDKGTGGESYTFLGKKRDEVTGQIRRVCFLKVVRMKEIDVDQDYGGCYIIEIGSDAEAEFWLKANGWGTDDAEAWCEAQCLCWDRKKTGFPVHYWCADTD